MPVAAGPGAALWQGMTAAARLPFCALLLLSACDDGGETSALPDAPEVEPPCDGIAGTFHHQSLQVEGEERFYFLHVPATYDCTQAWPLLVDFHGTSGGTEPEVSYKNDELVALADAEGFIAVRPRSRSSAVEGLGDVFRWDQNPVSYTHLTLPTILRV